MSQYHCKSMDRKDQQYLNITNLFKDYVTPIFQDLLTFTVL